MPWPKLRFMVDEATKNSISIEIMSSLAKTKADQNVNEINIQVLPPLCLMPRSVVIRQPSIRPANSCARDGTPEYQRVCHNYVTVHSEYIHW